MGKSLCLLFGFTLLAPYASAQFVSNTTGWASADAYAYTSTHNYSNSYADSGSQTDPTSAYLGFGDYQYISDSWQAQFEYISGYDQNGDPIYDYYYEDQYEEAYAEAHSYATFGFGTTALHAATYAFSASSTSGSGSQANPSASASASAGLTMDFTLLHSGTYAFSSNWYDNTYLDVYREGTFIASVTSLSNYEELFLVAGNYNITGYSGGYGYSELSISPLSTVPEPATLAVLGIGALGLLRRQRRKGNTL